MNSYLEEELAKLKKEIFDLKEEVNRLKIVLPDWFSLGDIARQINVNIATLRSHLKAHFEENKDFKLFGGKIYASKDALFLIRQYYENKRK